MELKQKDMITSYVCVDVETTGLDPKEEKLIEIGAVKVVDGQVSDTFQSFVNPGRSLSARIVSLTGITDEMLADAPLPKEVMGKFHEFCGDLPLLGHNLRFDYSFLKRAMVNEGYAFDKSGLDTLRIARKYLPELESRSLVFLCEHFGIVHTAHRALGDAVATTELYGKLCELFYEKAQKEDCKVFIPVSMIYNIKRQQPISVPQKEQILRYCAKLGITLNRDLEQMTRSEASRFIEKYRLEYKALE